MQSAWKGRDDIVALLIAAGADVNYHDTQVTNRQIMNQSYNFCFQVPQLIFFTPHHKNIHRQAGDTALMWATYMGHVAIMSALLQAGADTNAYNKVRAHMLSQCTDEHHLMSQFTEDITSKLNLCMHCFTSESLHAAHGGSQRRPRGRLDDAAGECSRPHAIRHGKSMCSLLSGLCQALICFWKGGRL